MGVSTKALSIALAQFRNDGYTILRGFIPQSELSVLRQETQKLYETAIQHYATYKHGNLTYEILPEAYFGARYVIQAHWFSWASSYFDEFRSHPAYLQILEPLIGRNIKQVAQQIHWKPPGASLTGYRFHQDLRFRESRDAYQDVVRDSVTIGVAIDPSNSSNGCLRVIPKSHTNGYLGLSDDGEGQVMKGLTHDDELVAVGLNPVDIVDVVLEPGDAIVWGLLTVHGSLPNNSQHDRAFAISSYVRADTSHRGEWAFRDGAPMRLGTTPQLCKNERLFDNLEPHYDETKWFL